MKYHLAWFRETSFDHEAGAPRQCYSISSMNEFLPFACPLVKMKGITNHTIWKLRGSREVSSPRLLMTRDHRPIFPTRAVTYDCPPRTTVVRGTCGFLSLRAGALVHTKILAGRKLWCQSTVHATCFETRVSEPGSAVTLTVV